MNREDVAMDVTVQNVEILRGRLEQAENLLQAVVDEHGELSCDLHEQIDIFLASQQGERNQCDGCQAGIPLVDGAHRMGRQGGYPDLMSCQKERYKHPEQAEDDIKKLIVLLRHGDAMPGEQDLAADHLERLLKAEQAEGAQGEREAFEAWIAQAISRRFVPEYDLAKFEDSGEYRYNPAADYWKAWQARAALAQPSPAQVYACPECGTGMQVDPSAKPSKAQPYPAPELERGSIYVEAHECIGCGHSGINDAADGFATCSACAWIGKEPVKDECPKCQRENVMSAACPMCHCRYILIADGHIKAPVAQAGLVPEVSGIARAYDHPSAVILYLRKEPTDDDLRAIQEGLRVLAAAPQPAKGE